MKPKSPDLPFDPFAARAVGDPWRSPEPDIATVNAQPFESIIKLLGQIHKTPNLSALVLGEAGSGKSHLIKRLMTAQGNKLIFVYVHPMKNPVTMFSNLLERVMTNLDCSPMGLDAFFGCTQLDLIVANVIIAALEENLKGGQVKIPPHSLKALKANPVKIFQQQKNMAKWAKILSKTEEFLASKLPKDLISKMVLKLLFHYLDDSKRTIVQYLLSGYPPDEDDAKALGIRFHEIDLTIEAQEERSKQILKAIGRLLRFYRPMILCFDQLENLDTTALISSFGKLISEIVNEVDNILPIAFMRPDTLESGFSEENLDKAARDRLTSEVIPLQGCNLEQALDIIKARLNWAFEGSSQARPNPFYPFQEEVLRTEILKDGNTPRMVLTTASKLMGHKFVPEDPVAIVKKCFHAEREQLLAAPNKEPFAKDTIVEALHLYFGKLKNNLEYEIIHFGQDKNVDLRLEIKRLKNKAEKRKLDIAVETSSHGKTLIKNLGNLITRIQTGNTDVAVFLRDADSPIPPAPNKMPKTVEQLKIFEDCGGTKLYVDYSQLADLYALVYTRNKIPPGDLSYVSNDRGDRKVVSMEDFASFLTAHYKSSFLANIEKKFLTGKTSRSKPPPGITPEQGGEIVSRIIEVLDRPPYKFKLEQIASHLQKQKGAGQITLDQLAVVISQHNNVIGYYAVTPPIYFLK
ncbi:hypothetical protein [Desulfomonile tiedjei]|uniref:Orc1-like AAA ATPase domain-containing protein n=1 Tax=Desulfomonile tiedjei (strain ATCC 49306 / DSM 6799 / DCB-1) TaxID=706587 RepID=I4C4N8_DESTA|nr:hypothetical protein [Desulfomonile tiedjei]AFM24529.1 hypothetical protein Desti_1821 [Desulfomonile tiedjei DSM 6799]